MKFSGVITALVTPFLEGKLDEKSFFRLLQSQVNQGIKQFVLNSTTGESSTLSVEDLETLCQWFEKFKGEEKAALTLWIGTGSPCTKKTVENSKRAEALGANALLVVTPYYNRPSQKGLLLHYEKVAHTTSLPLFLYNVPLRTGLSLEEETLIKLAQVENIKGIKEASGNMEFAKKILKIKDFLFLSGDDFTCVESFLLGGHGVISACSNVMGRTLNRWFVEALKKESPVVQEFQKLQPFLKKLYQETNPLGVKQALAHLGVISSSFTRLPLFNSEEDFDLRAKVDLVRGDLL